MKIDWGTITLKNFAAVISEKLRQGGVETILVGGACVSMYTKNRYQSYDIDLVTHASIKSIVPILEEVGFRREGTRHFIKKGCPFFIDFVSPPAALGSEPVVDRSKVKTKYGTIVMLTATDSVKDRLAGYYHWKDPQSFEQALLIAREHNVDLKEIERWSRKEGATERHKDFMKELERTS
jgi:hypothetical protein